MHPSLTSRLIALEAGIRYGEPPPEGEQEFSYHPGRLPVLLSAPHGAAHTRKGRLKQEDEYTAAFARLVAEESRAHVLYAHHKSPTDPNYYHDTPYKDHLREIVERADIRFVLDIHGAAADRDFGIALGTMSGRSCPNHEDVIIRTFEAHGFWEGGSGLTRLAVNPSRFTGGNRHATVTQFVCNWLNHPAAQFELNAHLRIVRRLEHASTRKCFSGDPKLIEQAVHAFVDLVRVLSDTILSSSHDANALYDYHRCHPERSEGSRTARRDPSLRSG